MLPQGRLTYVDVYGILPLLDRLCYQARTELWDPPNLLLTGPAGVAKTLLLAYLAQEERLPYLSIDCTEETRERQIRGGFIVRSGETPFVMGTATNAIHVANEVGAALLVIEELPALTPQMQKLVNSITDFRRKIELPELSTRIELRPDAKLWVCATRNPSVYGGGYELNQDLKSRFMEIEVPYPPQEGETRILRELAPPGFDIADEALTTLVNIARETRQSATSYALSPRDLVQFLQVLPRMDWQDTLFLIAQKFPPESRKLVIDRISAITNLPVAEGLNQRRP